MKYFVIQSMLFLHEITSILFLMIWLLVISMIILMFCKIKNGETES